MATRTFGRLRPWIAVGIVVFAAGCATPSGYRSFDSAQREYDQGLALYNSGDAEGAREAFWRASLLVERGELRSDIEYQLGKLALESGEPIEALEHFTTARHSTYRRLQLFRAWSGIGEAHYRMLDYARAADAFAESLAHESDPTFLDEIHYKLAVSLRRSGRPEEGARHFAQVRSYAPGPGEQTYEGSPPPSAAQGPRGFLAFPATIASRSEWGARPTRANHDPMSPIFRITIHHSAETSFATGKASAAREIQRIQRLHQDDRHWADIGYHFVIDRGGRVWEGRPLDLQGAHAGNHDLNRGNVGVVLLGNFNDQAVSPDQEHSLRMLVAYLMERYDVRADHLFTHGELKNTECPGTDLQQLVDRLRVDFTGRGSARHLALRGEIRHLVERGETLFGIARRYGVSVSDLRDANAELRDDRVLVGQELRIPEPSS
jgi:tetratricopeptide (TPR) repeat protein